MHIKFLKDLGYQTAGNYKVYPSGTIAEVASKAQIHNLRDADRYPIARASKRYKSENRPGYWIFLDGIHRFIDYDLVEECEPPKPNAKQVTRVKNKLKEFMEDAGVKVY